jgi:hypothetical protein
MTESFVDFFFEGLCLLRVNQIGGVASTVSRRILGFPDEERIPVDHADKFPLLLSTEAVESTFVHHLFESGMVADHLGIGDLILAKGR